jgi:hypothetical protein
MSSDDRSRITGPILFWGISAGMVSSLMCCFWPTAMGGAYFAVRGARRDHEISSGTSATIGGVTGAVAGLIIATFGTALVLSQWSPEQIALIDSIGLGAEAPSMGVIAAVHAFLGFGAGATFGLIGGAMAASGPPPKGRPRPVRPVPRAPVPPAPIPAPVAAAPVPVAEPAPDPEPEVEPEPSAEIPPLAEDGEPSLDEEGENWNVPVSNNEPAADEVDAGTAEEEDEGVDKV